MTGVRNANSTALVREDRLIGGTVSRATVEGSGADWRMVSAKLTLCGNWTKNLHRPRKRSAQDHWVEQAQFADAAFARELLVAKEEAPGLWWRSVAGRGMSEGSAYAGRRRSRSTTSFDGSCFSS
jgi:hypothetical protein